MEVVTIQIIPVVIKLACDMDNLVQQLFEPLAIGIMHYFASGIQYNSIYTPIVIDILMVNKIILYLLIHVVNYVCMTILKGILNHVTFKPPFLAVKFHEFGFF